MHLIQLIQKITNDLLTQNCDLLQVSNMKTELKTQNREKSPIGENFRRKKCVQL